MAHEAKWILLSLVVPTLAVHVSYVLLSESPIPIVDRLLFREDACPYFSCLAAGLLISVFLNAGRLVRKARGSPRKNRDAP
jgi:hypothetical protein